MSVGSYTLSAAEPGILAPAVVDQELDQKIRALRANGRVVIRELPGQSGQPGETGVTEKLEKTDQGWTLVPLA